jgi:hypothetical protein
MSNRGTLLTLQKSYSRNVPQISRGGGSQLHPKSRLHSSRPSQGQTAADFLQPWHHKRRPPSLIQSSSILFKDIEQFKSKSRDLFSRSVFPRKRTLSRSPPHTRRDLKWQPIRISISIYFSFLSRHCCFHGILRLIFFLELNAILVLLMHCWARRSTNPLWQASHWHASDLAGLER